MEQCALRGRALDRSGVCCIGFDWDERVVRRRVYEKIHICEEEWLFSKDSSKMLKLYDSITSVLEGDSFVTISIIYPILCGLNEMLARTDLATEESEFLRRGLLQNLRHRVSFVVTFDSNWAIAASSSYIVPRFENCNFYQLIIAAECEITQKVLRKKKLTLSRMYRKHRLRKQGFHSRN